MRSIYLYQCLYFEKYDVPYYIKLEKLKLMQQGASNFVAPFCQTMSFTRIYPRYWF